MDDFKIIIYILAAVAYFIITQWRKAFKGGDEDVDVEPRRPQQHQQPPRPVTSFEDILRELQPKLDQANRQGQEVTHRAKDKARELSQPAPAMVPVPEAASRYKNYETTAPRKLSWEKRAEAIEAAKQAQFRRQASFKAYAESKPQPSPYVEKFRNPASVREAFILSEILHRKYT